MATPKGSDDKLAMDETNPDSWFNHEFGPPRAGDRWTLADYANDPPRGMNNPPMNLALREILCKDLVEYGLELQVPEWGGGFQRTSSSAPTSPAHSRLARAATSRTMLMRSYTEKLRTGQTLKAGSIFSRSAPAIIASSQEEESAPAHPDWHQYHPLPHTLRPIDARGPVCFIRTTPSASSTTEKEKRSVHFAEDAQKTLIEHLEYKGSPINAGFIKTPSHEKALTMGKKMTLDSSGKRSSADAPGKAKKSKDSSKDGAKDEDAKNLHNNGEKIDNKDLDNRMRGLRGMSQLHRAAVADRFRFGASSSAGDPMVLGTSTLNQANPGNWASDAAFLNKFHNSAIRIVHPSGLEMLKEPTSKRKKKKKKDDEEDLKLSDSGLFVARYPIDEGLKALRRIRKRAFPEEVLGKTQSELEKEKHQEKAKVVATELKEEFPGQCLLSRVRESEEELKEQAAAVARSGYLDDFHATVA